jgi:hypothetical protein
VHHFEHFVNWRDTISHFISKADGIRAWRCDKRTCMISPLSCYLGLRLQNNNTMSACSERSWSNVWNGCALFLIHHHHHNREWRITWKGAEVICQFRHTSIVKEYSKFLHTTSRQQPITTLSN